MRRRRSLAPVRVRGVCVPIRTPVRTPVQSRVPVLVPARVRGVIRVVVIRVVPIRVLVREVVVEARHAAVTTVATTREAIPTRLRGVKRLTDA